MKKILTNFYLLLSIWLSKLIIDLFIKMEYVIIFHIYYERNVENNVMKNVEKDIINFLELFNGYINGK